MDESVKIDLFLLCTVYTQITQQYKWVWYINIIWKILTDPTFEI